MLIYSIIWIFITIVLLFLLFLYFFNRKLNLLENKILENFWKRTNLIPALFEVTRDILVRHDDVFLQSLILRKEEFSKIWEAEELYKFIDLEVRIHKELNFIYKVCNKHPKLLKDSKFVYLRELLIDSSSEIWIYLEKYKKFVKKFNFLILIKDLSIIWFFVPIRKKIEL